MSNHSTNNSTSIPESELKAIVNNCIKNNFHIFKAFDVADGVITMKQYLEEINSKQKGE